MPLPETPRALPPWWWTTAVALLVVSCAVVAPVSFATHLELTPLDVPDPRWSLDDVRAALADLGVRERWYTLWVHLQGQAVAAAFLAVAVVVGRHRPRDRGALVVSLLLAAAGWGTAGTHLGWAELHPAAAASWRVLGMAAWSCLPLVLYVFPDGKFRPRWAVWFAAAGVASYVGGAVPWARDLPGWPPVSTAVGVAFVVVAVLSTVLRVRRGGAVVRQQVTWVAWSVTLPLVALLTGFAVAAAAPRLTAPGTEGFVVATVMSAVPAWCVALVPVAVGVSVARHRLWDVDPLVNRTVVWGTVSLACALAYLAVVGGVDLVLRGQGGVVAPVAAAAAVAVIAEPTRRRVQAAVNRVSFGDRDAPHRVASRLAERTGQAQTPQEVLTVAAVTVGDALRLPAVGIDVVDHAGAVLVSASTGRPGAEGCEGVEGVEGVEGGAVESAPLLAHGEHVGQLWWSPRAPGETLGPRDLRLVGQLLPHLATSALAVRSTEELRRARRRLVRSSSEERRRLRRHLHDEVGPDLAASALDLDVAVDLLPRDPGAAGDLVRDVRDRLQHSVTGVRGVAYGLYPPELEQLGLAGALRDLAGVCGSQSPTTLDVQVHLQAHEHARAGGAVALPAAVQVAAYRIAGEALRNVARHAGASSCQVRVALDDGYLVVTVADDGTGPAGSRPGAGRLGMAERAEELGGSVVVLGPPGTTVVARLPLAGEG